MQRFITNIQSTVYSTYCICSTKLILPVYIAEVHITNTYWTVHNAGCKDMGSDLGIGLIWLITSTLKLRSVKSGSHDSWVRNTRSPTHHMPERENFDLPIFEHLYLQKIWKKKLKIWRQISSRGGWEVNAIMEAASPPSTDLSSKFDHGLGEGRGGVMFE